MQEVHRIFFQLNFQLDWIPAGRKFHVFLCKFVKIMQTENGIFFYILSIKRMQNWTDNQNENDRNENENECGMSQISVSDIVEFIVQITSCLIVITINYSKNSLFPSITFDVCTHTPKHTHEKKNVRILATWFGFYRLSSLKCIRFEW